MGRVLVGRSGIKPGKSAVRGLGDIASGTCVITRAVHKLEKSGGLTTSVESDTPKGAAAE